MKFLASILAAQLPRDVQARVKDKVRDIGDELEGDQGRELIQVVKRELTEHGHLLNKGNRDFEGIAKVAVVSKLEANAETASTRNRQRRKVGGQLSQYDILLAGFQEGPKQIVYETSRGLLYLWREPFLEVLPPEEMSRLWSKGTYTPRVQS